MFCDAVKDLFESAMFVNHVASQHFKIRKMLLIYACKY